MTEIKIYCDHCGKVLDEMSDYVDLTIEAAHKRKHTDLCTDCFEKLFVVLDGFCEKKGGVTDTNVGGKEKGGAEE